MDKEYRLLGKAIRGRLRELAGQAYENELGAQLDELMAAFAAWKGGEVTADDVSERIHVFHQGPARDISTLYTRLKPDRIVARAIALGILGPEDVDDETIALLDSEIEVFRQFVDSDYEKEVGN